MKHSQRFLFIVWFLGFVVGLILGCWLCNREQAVIHKETLNIDTIKYYKPTPIVSKPHVVNIPKFIFQPADTVVKTVIKTEYGYTDMSFKVESREYRDSSYYAIISGAVVGDRRPSLDYFETYNKTVTREIVIMPKKIRPYIGASIGVFGEMHLGLESGILINDKHIVGIEYQRGIKNNAIGIKYGFVFQANKNKKR